MYEDHVDRVFGFFAFRLGPGADAEDLTATTFERAMRNAGRYDPRRAAMSTWLLAIAQNALIDHFRYAGRRPEEHGDVDFDALPHPAFDEPREGLAPELEAALGGLDDRERQVVALRFGGELRGKEIASVTGLTEANVHQILSRSLRRLRRAMPDR
jgi:RNA polymerase sigma-70 factor (ECF subfamily)